MLYACLTAERTTSFYTLSGSGLGNETGETRKRVRFLRCFKNVIPSDRCFGRWWNSRKESIDQSHRAKRPSRSDPRVARAPTWPP